MKKEIKENARFSLIDFPKKNTIKAIIFDVGDVLALSRYSLKTYDGKTFHLGVHEDVAKKLKISLDQYFDSIDSIYANSIEGKISLQEALEAISKNFKISRTKLKQIYFNTYQKHFKQNKHLFGKAKLLKKRGYKIAILSDQWYLSKRVLMPKKLYAFFDVLVVSCDVGIRKPNPEIYELVLEKLKLKPDEAIFIDNQEWNLIPAQKLGMSAILFKDNKQLFSDDKWGALWR